MGTTTGPVLGIQGLKGNRNESTYYDVVVGYNRGYYRVPFLHFLLAATKYAGCSSTCTA